MPGIFLICVGVKLGLTIIEGRNRRVYFENKFAQDNVRTYETNIDNDLEI